MLILGIESSCDESAAAIAELKNNKIRIVSEAVSSQIEIHKKYQGVIPEVAAREHTLNLLPIIAEALERAKIKPDLAGKKLSAIAVTTGPGLITSLIVGTETAKSLAVGWQLPMIDVNHIEAHIAAALFGRDLNKIKFPAVILTVSGGHTALTLMRGLGDFRSLGETLDDAAGESFDKAAKILGLGYPGGPALEKNASAKNQLPAILPRPMINSGDFNFSFSGLKTALLYAFQKDKNRKKNISSYAAEFQNAVADVLTAKTMKAAEKFKAKTVILAGGVAANRTLRNRLAKAIASGLPKSEFVMPEIRHCTDNAAMVATAGALKAKRKKFTPWKKIKADPNKNLNAD